MELKNYQIANLQALDRFLGCVEQCNNIAKGFTAFWQTNNPAITPAAGSIITPYKDNVQGAPHVCMKVPTGGGKTFIAAAALKIAIDHTNPPYKVVVWLVPSNAILEQTLRNLRNKQHPYRQRIDTDFQNRVEVFDKQQALTGQGFSLTTVRENLCILVLSFDSLRTNNKDGRKVYQENGYLQSFAPLIKERMDNTEEENDDEVQLMRVLQAVHPIVIVDESHNAVSKLSEQMLNDLHPSLVLDLTATPKQNSNIICFTDALELKRNNMVKLPVIVYNHNTKAQVYDSALHLQRSLEQAAKAETSDNYIRPIVLFQAESRQQNTEDREVIDKVKDTLLELNIPEEQIKIKTAEIDELKGIDLMSPSCPVRYIITINALKEGWDCPFAYILASLADKSSSVVVEQIVGRVLRLPHARRNKADILNLSYVLTASAKFQETLDNVVKGLNHAGFSDKDYRSVELPEPAIMQQPKEQVSTPTLFPLENIPQYTTSETSPEDEVNVAEISFNPQETTPTDIDTPSENQLPSVKTIVTDILNNAKKEAMDMDKQIKQQNGPSVPIELTSQVKTAKINSYFVESAQQVKLPMFFTHNDAPDSPLFGRPEDVLLTGEALLKSFRLSEQDTNISFAAVETNMYGVDIDENNDEHIPIYKKVEGQTYSFILDYIRKAEDQETKIRRCTQVVSDEMGKMIPLSPKDVQEYVKSIFTNFSGDQVEDFMLHLNERTLKIKQKILNLEDAHKERVFRQMLDTDQIYLLPAYSIPDEISLRSPYSGIAKMLHTKEDEVNGFEREVINDVANLENVEWWTRNIDRRDFCINGFINHYPDFIIKTKKGKIILLETKGDHLDAKKKATLGELWKNKAGEDYRYYLVYNTREEENTLTKEEFIQRLRLL